MTETTPKQIAVLQPGDQRLVGFVQKAAALKATAGSYVIDSREMYEVGAEELREIKRTFDEVEAVRDSIVRPMNTAVKNTNALFRPITEALDVAKRALSASMLAFEDAEREKLRAAEAEAEAARQREIAEAEAKLAEANASGDTAAAEAALMQTQMAAIGSAVADTGKVERGGNARRDGYEVVVEDVAPFLRWLADQMDQHPDRFNNTVTFKVSQLNSFATDTQGRVAIPGAIVKKKSTLAVRTK